MIVLVLLSESYSEKKIIYHLRKEENSYKNGIGIVSGMSKSHKIG